MLFHRLSADLVSEIASNAIKKELSKDTEISREGQLMSALPVVLSGLLKVYKQYEKRDLLHLFRKRLFVSLFLQNHMPEFFSMIRLLLARILSIPAIFRING
ncbi:MAG: hypothetical protein GVY02_05800 [Bacteroidetes bacterium]|jgi:ferric iron reductase protein FhuF|nr:hypothetical protein [Bacteroidota bacterium]